MAVNLPVSGLLIYKMIIVILAFVKYFEICGGKVMYKDRHCYFKGTGVIDLELHNRQVLQGEQWEWAVPYSCSFNNVGDFPTQV